MSYDLWLIWWNYDFGIYDIYFDIEKVIYLFLRKYGNYFVFVRVYDLKKF